MACNGEEKPDFQIEVIIGIRLRYDILVSRTNETLVRYEVLVPITNQLVFVFVFVFVLAHEQAITK